MENLIKKMMLLIDVFFVLLLCFVVLLFTMFLNKNVAVCRVGQYEINPHMLAVVTISVFSYIFIIVKISTMEFSEIYNRMVSLLYGGKNLKNRGKKL